MSDDLTLGIGVSVDKSDAKQAERILSQFVDDANRFKKATEENGDAVSNFTRQLNNAKRTRAFQSIADEAGKGRISSKQLEKALLDVGATDKEMLQVAKNVERIETSLREAQQQAFAFNDALRQADASNSNARRIGGFAGDVGTAGRTVGGAVGFLGGSATRGAEQAFQAGAEIVETAEAIAQLKGISANAGTVLRQLVSTIGASGAGLIGGVVALTAVMALAQREFARQRQAVSDEIETASTVLERAFNNTTEDFESNVSDLESQRRRAQVFLEELEANHQAFLDATVNQGVGVERALGNIAIVQDRLDLFGGGALDALTDAIAEQEREIRNIDQTLATYESSAIRAIVAENDRQAEIERTAQALEDARLSEIAFQDTLVETGRQVALFLSDPSLTTDSLQRRIATLERERESILNVVNAENLTDESRTRYVEQLRTIDEQLRILNETGFQRTESLELEARALELIATIEAEREQSAVDAITRRAQQEQELLQIIENTSLDGLNSRLESLQRERDSIVSQMEELAVLAETSDVARNRLHELGAQLQNVDDSLQQFGVNALPSILENAQGELVADLTRIRTEAGLKIKEIITGLDTQLTDIENKLKDTLTNATETRDSDLAELDNDAYVERIALAQEYSANVTQLERDLVLERENIIRSSTTQLANAIGQRDALQAYLAQQQRDNDLDELEASGEVRREQLAGQFEEQQKVIEANLTTQRVKINNEYAKRVSDAIRNAQTESAIAQQKAQASIQAVRTKEQAELSMRNQAFNAQLNQLSSWANASNTIVAGFVKNTLGSLSALGGKGQHSLSLNNTANLNLTVNNPKNQSRLSRQQVSQVQQQVNNTVADMLRGVILR